MYSIYFTLCAFFFNELLLIAYFFRKKVKKIENVFYSGLIIASFIGLLDEMLCAYIILVKKMSPTSWQYIFAVKGIYAFFLFFVACLVVYFHALVRRQKPIKTIVFAIMLTIMCILNLLVVVPLPLEMLNINGTIVPLGPCAIVSDILASIYILIIIGVTFYNRKYLKPREYIPIVLTIVLFFVDVYVQIAIQLFISFPIYTFVAFVMYFTIENPDIKMLEKIEISKNMADKANMAKTDFLSSMSHEIRTPLNAIVGFSEGLKEENLSKEGKEAVDDIISASQTLLETVNGILDISKIEANKIEIIQTDYSFNEVFNELVNLAKARLGDDKPVLFKYRKTDDIPDYLYGDYSKIKQIILNLLTNAIKYTKEGYIYFDVSCINIDDNCKLIIKVEDTGMGIKKEAIDKLFDKFERLDNENSSIEGTGLGLSITKKLIEMMNGEIFVQSEYGKGSIFTVIINQKKVDKPIINTNDDSKEIVIEHNLVNKKVLVVDDNILNLKVIKNLLKPYNIVPIEITSGFECLDLINKGNTFDLILLDDMMPGKSGKETFKELKNNLNFNTPVIALTANAIEGMREVYLTLGFNNYLSKPIDKNELRLIIKEYLDK